MNICVLSLVIFRRGWKKSWQVYKKGRKSWRNGLSLVIFEKKWIKSWRSAISSGKVEKVLSLSRKSEIT